MNLAILVFMTLVGLALFFEGFSRKNPFIAWTGAILLMFAGTEIFVNGITLQSGFTYNQINSSVTTASIDYVQINTGLGQAIARTLFYIGYFGLVFPVIQLENMKKEEKEEEERI